MTYPNNCIYTYLGIIYSIDRGKDDGKIGVAPKAILSEGDGRADKGMKVEWATIKVV